MFGECVHDLCFAVQLAGFRLQHGPLPEQYRFQSQPEGARRHRHHKKGAADPLTPSHDQAAATDFGVGAPGAGGGAGTVATGDSHEKKPHKKKKNDDEKERKKKKKEKKKKKQRHSPEHVAGMSVGSGGDISKMIWARHPNSITVYIYV